MNCPYCGKELEWVDYFVQHEGAGIDRIIKRGNIYKCANETCVAYDDYYWAYSYDGILHEGYPC